ncbi:MAG: bifunctional ADP-dependent NAD(P)H-hydrate dehydratase/NAD(P)H-hydrate epimerase, partial [Clostridia bacterium]|nr:bifunctional ADP-dependent NAD(P)H-hydrate dehydratase/NAD(P)H-hydrate epimerase [Clostridia bacterium]
MKLVTAKGMQELEGIAIETYGISGLLLMENAARSFADITEEETGSVANKSVLIVCGKGNNGG